jgi:hypothetical protein
MKGSQWRKWNFHVHTKGTNKNDQFNSPTLEDFFHIFFKRAIANNVNAIGITDYFSIDNYYHTIQYVKEIENKVDQHGDKLFQPSEIKHVKDMFIFPNVELRMLPTTGYDRLINIHCLFNPDYVGELENKFFNVIENEARFPMNRKGLINYGKKMRTDLTCEAQLYKTGVDRFVVDIKSIKEQFDKEIDLRRNTIIVVSNSNKDGASGTQKHYDLFENENGSLDGVRKSIYEISNAIFSSNPKDIKYFLGKRLDEITGVSEFERAAERARVIADRGSLKACLVGCDAHSEDQLFTRYTWIKADLTFNGLRQILYEPEQRVKIQDLEPDYKEDKLIIDKVQFISGKKQFPSQPIYLNKNLNVIIGGKSSGKSILLYNIAKTLLADKKLLQEEQIMDKYKFREDDNAYNFEITTKGGFKQLMYRNAEDNSIMPEITYIPQNYLVKLAEPEGNRKGSVLNKLIRNLIQEDFQAKNRYDEFLSQVQLNDKKRDTTIDNYFALREKVNTLQLQLAQKSNKSILQKNIETNTQKVKELLEKNAGQTKAEIDKYNELQQKSERSKIHRSKIGNDYTKLVNFNKEAREILQGLKNKKALVKQSLETQAFISFTNSSYSNIEIALQELETVISKFDLVKDNKGVNYFKIKSEVENIFVTCSNERAEIEKELQPFLTNAAVQKEIELIQKSIGEDKTLIHEIDQLSKEIDDTKKALSDEKNKLFNLCIENYQEYIKLITDLKSRIQNLEQDGLKISGLVKFNFPKLQNEILEISDQRTASYRNYDFLSKEKTGLSNYEITSLVNDFRNVFEAIVENESYVLKRVDKKIAVKTLLYDHFFDYWEIEYKSDKLGSMSAGKASFVILMLIVGLSKSKAPILIDQPEDNLDNRSITSDLVEYLRRKKLERQIILVTHNPNIVVNADAENIIVAHQKGQDAIESSSPYQFDYVNGSLENSFPKNNTELDLLKCMGIKEHIAEIVEGGKEAFIRREAKYGFRDGFTN